MSEARTIPWDEIVGRNLQGLREAHGLRQEDVAVKARDYGLDWDRVTVANVERGARSMNVSELVLLSAALGIQPADFFLGSDEVVPPKVKGKVKAKAIRAVLSGRGSETKLGDFDVPATRRTSRVADQAIHLFDHYGYLWPGANAGQLMKAERSAAGEAEQKAARALKIDPVALSVVAHRRWDGHGLTEERDRRVAERISAGATPRTVQAVRGHVTRALIEELRALLTGDQTAQIVTNAGRKKARGTT